MSHDSVIRTAAVVAAVALLAAPYRSVIAGWLAQAAEAAKRHRALAGRVAAAALLIAAAWGKVPLPKLPAPQADVRVDTPSDDMQRLVTPIADALKGVQAGNRLLWASVWQKAGVVVAGDAVSAQTVFTDTRSLQAFTALALDIGWRRIGEQRPNDALRAAVEAAYAAHLGKDVVPVTAEVRARYAELAEAIAWAGLNKG